MIDLRSDTVTRPTSAMRQAMANAEVGDDMMGEDPTVNALEERMASMFGKETAVFACSGTQANQMAVRAHCSPGDELLIHETGHIAVYEAGAPAALSGVTVRALGGDHGMLDVEHLEGQPRRQDQHLCPTRLVCLENTTNLGGGRCYSADHLRRVSDWCREHSLKRHLDGARLFNALAASDATEAIIGDCFDTISVCFSKGLGCPMGSVLIGDQASIQRARRARKQFGGALRQAGIIAAAALYALDHHRPQLTTDHANARTLAEGVNQIPGLHAPPETVETNLVYIDVSPELGSAQQLVDQLAEKNVRLFALGPQRLRAVTHRDIDASQIKDAQKAFADAVSKR